MRSQSWIKIFRCARRAWVVNHELSSSKVRKLFNQRVQVVWTEHSSSRFPRAFLLIIVAVSRNREEGKHCSRRCYVGDGDDRSWSRPWSNRSVYYISNLARIHYYPGETRIKSRGSCPDNASSVAHPVNAKFDTNDSRGIEIESSSNWV